MGIFKSKDLGLKEKITKSGFLPFGDSNTLPIKVKLPIGRDKDEANKKLKKYNLRGKESRDHSYKDGIAYIIDKNSSMIWTNVVFLFFFVGIVVYMMYFKNKS